MRRLFPRDDSPARQTLAHRGVPTGALAALLRGARTALRFVGLLSLVLTLTAGVIAEGLLAKAARRLRIDKPANVRSSKARPWVKPAGARR